MLLSTLSKMWLSVTGQKVVWCVKCQAWQKVVKIDEVPTNKNGTQHRLIGRCTECHYRTSTFMTAS